MVEYVSVNYVRFVAVLKQKFFFCSPHGARVSGVVEETPGRLEYEVALYKEAPARLTNLSHNSELPVDQAVPIGTKLQLRARINPHSGNYHNDRWRGHGVFLSSSTCRSARFVVT